MKAFCVDNRYADMLFVLNELFPEIATTEVSAGGQLISHSSRDPFLPSDRLKWLSRVYCEQNNPSEAIAMIRRMSASSKVAPAVYMPALRTIVQTCSKYRRSAEVLAAYELMQQSIAIGDENDSSSADQPDTMQLLGNDFMSLFRAAKALDRNELACAILTRWQMCSRNASATDMVPTHVQFCQGVACATRINAFSQAHQFLDVLHKQGFANISSLAASTLYSNFVQNGGKLAHTDGNIHCRMY
jgi:hypothetical protein